MGLSKVNEDWVPLQTKVFSRWVSTQLKYFPNIEVNDIQKDLSNGVALVELATVLTHKKPSRGWYENPKMKIEMVQNCELALDMFCKDGVNFVGISGKDISDNNTKLILGLVWTLILHYSVGNSIKDTDFTTGRYTNESNEKINKQTSKNNKITLLSWATERTEHYPNVHNFAPFDLSLCALLDSYFPNKVNYYSLNPEDSEHNAKLATKIMEEVGIPVLVYPEELKKTNNMVDEKTLLTQLSSAKIVLDETESKRNSESEQIDIQTDITNSVNDQISIQNNIEKTDSETDENTEEDEDQEESQEINELRQTLAECQHEIEVLKNAREISEKERNQATIELSKLQKQYEIEKTTREKRELELSQEKMRNEKSEVIIEELRDTIRDMQKQFALFYAENELNDEEVKRLRCAWEMAQIEIENERDVREEAEFQLEQFKLLISKRTTVIEEAQQQCRLLSFINCIGNMQAEMNHKIELIEEKVDRAQQNLIHLKNSNQVSTQTKNNSNEESEVERLRCAWDMGQIEIENERNQLVEKEFELENLKHEINNDNSNIEKEELKYRIPNFINFIGQIQFQMNQKIESMEERIDDIKNKVFYFKRELNYLKNQNQDLKLENTELNSRLIKEEKKYRATLLAYEDAIHAALKEAREQEEEREKADLTIEHLMQQLEAKNN